MKIDRHTPQTRSGSMKLKRSAHASRPAPGFTAPVLMTLLAVASAIAEVPGPATDAVTSEATTVSRAAANVEEPKSDPQAVKLLRHVLEMIVYGPAFDAKVREKVWTTGREVVGVGTYEQAGGGSGRYNLQITMHDGIGNAKQEHRLQQISDGRLAWTRTEIAGHVSLRRVDVGRLDQWVRGAKGNTRISPGLMVGAWAEMLSTVERDYVLRVDSALLKEEPVWVITGTLRSTNREKILADTGRQEWPMLYPSRIRIAIRSKPDAETGFGELLPVRMEYWSDAEQPDDEAAAQGRLITLIEIYKIREIEPPPAERFRFETRNEEVNFTNETDRYIQLYGVKLTERQRRQLRR